MPVGLHIFKHRGDGGARGSVRAGALGVGAGGGIPAAVPEEARREAHVQLGRRRGDCRAVHAHRRRGLLGYAAQPPHLYRSRARDGPVHAPRGVRRIAICGHPGWWGAVRSVAHSACHVAVALAHRRRWGPRLSRHPDPEGPRAGPWLQRRNACDGTAARRVQRVSAQSFHPLALLPCLA